MRIDNVTRGEFEDLKRTIRQMSNATPLNNSGMGRGEMYVDGGTITIANGGTLNVTGLLKGLGSLLWDGIVTLTSTFTAKGDSSFEGTLAVKGPTTLTGDMTVNGGGTITVGGSVPMEIGVTSLGLPGVEFSAGNALISTTSGVMMKSGTTGGRVSASAGAVSMALGAKSVAIGGTQIDLVGTTVVTGSFSATSKAFKIPHPLKPDTWLMHGVTESPVHGVEYAAAGTFDPDGACVVTLPDYFEALTKAEGRTVLITPIGKPYPVGADLPSGGTFTAYGDAGRSFSWLVKAARSDVEVIVEQPY